MSKNASRKRQVKPARVSPLIASYVQSLAPSTGWPGASAANSVPARAVRLSRTWSGVTVNRYQDGCELVFADGRKVEAASPLKLLWCLLTGGAR